ncbi:MAG: hypothetical protein GQE15_05875 [Archangiaceae bacterium]|nr:hypothetical protein [Archangiaceae bacterium]
MAPWERIAFINAGLASGDSARVEAALKEVEAFQREFPEGRPDFEFVSAFSCASLPDEVFERLTVAALEQVLTFESSLEAAMTAALQRAAAQQSAFVRVVQEGLCRVVEPEHLEPDHVFLRLLSGDEVASERLAEVLERALDDGRLLDFGPLLPKLRARHGDAVRAAAIASRARAEFDRLGRGHRLGDA